MKNIIIVICFTIAYPSVFGQQMIDSDSDIISDVHKIPFITEGKVVEKKSYWNTDFSLIYSLYKIEVHKVFKGDFTDTIYIISEGGVIDNVALEVYPSLHLNMKKKATFFLSPSNIDLHDAPPLFYKPLNNQHGVYAHDTNSNTVSHRLYGKLDKDVFNQKILNQPGTSLHKNPRFDEKKELEDLRMFLSAQTILNTPEITNFNLSSPIAGNKNSLTIDGSNFGSTTGMISFPNADDGGATLVDVLPDQILSWSDTQIIVEVPSKAGTGVFQITTANLNTTNSETDLVIEAAIINQRYPQEGETDSDFDGENEFPIVHVGGSSVNLDHINDGKYVFRMNNAFFSNPDAKSSMEAVFDQWACNTGLNFVWGSTTTKSVSAYDQVNLVSFSDQLATGTLGVTYRWSIGCRSNYVQPNPNKPGKYTDFHWVFSELDILFNSNYTWGYENVQSNEMDFYAVALHEVGHAHGLGHTIDSGNLMHYAVSYGQKNHENNSYFIATDEIVNRNISGEFCGYETHQLSQCYSLSTEISAADAQSVFLFPSIVSEELHIHMPFDTKQLDDVTFTIYDIQGKAINNDFLYKKSSQLSNSLLYCLDVSKLHSGLYFISFGRDQTTLRFIKQ